jgi:predicted flap endonuclease-1-like 5' DNA nuclease
MMYLISTFFFWLLLAAALGVLVSWITCGRGEGSLFSGILPWVLLLALGGLVALAQLLPQRPGFWFDLGVLMLAAYFVGGCIGGLLGHVFGKRLGEPVKSGALAAATSRPLTRVMIREKERAVEPQLKPLAVAAAAPEEAVVGLSGPRGGTGDDLTRIYGIDAETESKLNGLGIYHYDQLANLSPGNRRWVFRNLGHEGRFPSWWWRWRYDAEKLMGGAAGAAVAAAGLAGTSAVPGSAADTPATTTTALVASADGSLPATIAANPAVTSASAATDVPAAKASDTTKAPARTKPEAAAVSAGVPGTLSRPEPTEGLRPPALTGPRPDAVGDIEDIKGIGPKYLVLLREIGVFHYDQIAAWTPDHVEWVGRYVSSPARIEHEDWVGQARAFLASQPKR